MKASEARARYASNEKELTRRIVLRAAQSIKAESVLDLWGGGGFAREVVEAIPNVALVSAEIDPHLWPALTLDAQRHGYVAHQGNVRSVRGRFDLIWLDMTSQWSGSARDTVVAASKLVADGGLLAITLLAARETPEIAADRLYLVPRSIERASGLGMSLLWTYQTGSPMWLVVLRKGSRSCWDDTPDGRFPVERMLGSYFESSIVPEVKALGWWASPFDDAYDWIDEVREWTPHMPFPKPRPQRGDNRRIVHLADMTPDQRRAILAYLDVTEPVAAQMPTLARRLRATERRAVPMSSLSPEKQAIVRALVDMKDAPRTEEPAA